MATATFLALVEYSYGIPGKTLWEQVNKFDILTNKNTEIIKLFEKNVSKVISLKKFVISNEVAIPKEILSNT